MAREKFKCPGCGKQMQADVHEFVDVTEEPAYKEEIVRGRFFQARCSACGDETLVLYPMLYMDREKKLNIYMAPGHDDMLREQLNSLDVPEKDLDTEAVFRIVQNCDELLEKIYMADKGRDDRIMELYKVLTAEKLRESFSWITAEDLLYYADAEGEYLILCGVEDEEGAKPTMDVNSKLYDALAEDYIDVFAVAPNQYEEVNRQWIEERIEVQR